MLPGYHPQGRVTALKNPAARLAISGKAMNPEDEPQLGDLDSLLMSLVSEGSPRSDDTETICVEDLLVDEEGLPLALDEETRKARRMARNRRAAAESRDRKKRRVDELEGQVEVLERENSAPARLACAPLTGAGLPRLPPPPRCRQPAQPAREGDLRPRPGRPRAAELVVGIGHDAALVAAPPLLARTFELCQASRDDSAPVAPLVGQPRQFGGTARGLPAHPFSRT